LPGGFEIDIQHGRAARCARQHHALTRDRELLPVSWTRR
jgi:hypothetical protein